MKSIVWILFCISIFIVKADDGSYASNSGGPVASSSGGEGGGSGGGGGNLEPDSKCEKEENKKEGKVPLSSLFSMPNISVASVTDTVKSAPSAALGAGSSLLSGGTSAIQSGASTVFEGAKNLMSASADIIKNLPNFNPKAEFDKFMTKYGKSYPTTESMEKAMMNFIGNFKSMITFVLGRRSPFDASFAVTEFMDLVYDDFVKGFCGAQVSSEDATGQGPAQATETKKSCLSANWTSLEVIPEVRRQEKCGCCYAMSTSDMIAAQYVIDKKIYHKRYNLAPQWMMDCLEPPVAFHCNGGRPVKVLQKVSEYTRWNNLPLDTCLPYKDKNETCVPNPKCPDAPNIEVKWGKMVDVSGEKEQDTMAALLRHGPVVAIVAVNNAWMMYNGSGVLRSYQCDDKQNHAVLVTGYDYSSCVPNYIIKNSWGTKWGGKGYIRIEAGKNTCAVAKNIVFTCTSPDCENEDPFKYATTKSKHPDCESS